MDGNWLHIESVHPNGYRRRLTATTLKLSEPVTPKPTQTPMIKSGTGQRIMVVDDEPAVAMVLRLTLQKCGYAPEVYTLPMDAWNRFAQTPEDFDLLMIDQNMPDLGGPEFIQRARKISPSIPIIMMGGRLERSEMFSDQEISGVSALKKPFEVSELIAVVDHSLQEVRNV